MSLARIAMVAGLVVLAAFVVAGVVALHAEFALAIVVILAVLIAGGNLLYGRHSHGAAAVARNRPAQEAHDDAADRAAEARRAATEALRQGRGGSRGRGRTHGAGPGQPQDAGGR